MLTPSGALSSTFDGTVEAMAGDTLTMRPRAGGGRSQLYTPAPHAQLFVLTGHRSSITRGGAIGGVVGMLAGGVWGLARQQECSAVHGNLCVDRKSLALKEGIVLGVSGAFAGMVFGALDRREVWTRAWMLDVATAESSRGVRGMNVGFSFAF